MAFLPKFQSDVKELGLLQSTWAAILNVFIQNPSNQCIILHSVSLASGANSINHLLGRKLIGWRVVRWHGAWVQIYDTQDTNQIPDLTLNLVTGGAVTVDIEVF